MASIMGLAHMFGSVMQTSFSLLKDTVFFIMSITVLAGALSALFSEFGVITLLQKIITPIMRPLFGLPGVASLGAITAFLSDNPAILALAKDRRIRGYFKKYEIAALTNIGTGFGMVATSSGSSARRRMAFSSPAMPKRMIPARNINSRSS